jgi:hypothetical protein
LEDSTFEDELAPMLLADIKVEDRQGLELKPMPG